jgi:hypothetical protein
VFSDCFRGVGGYKQYLQIIVDTGCILVFFRVFHHDRCVTAPMVATEYQAECDDKQEGQEDITVTRDPKKYIRTTNEVCLTLLVYH